MSLLEIILGLLVLVFPGFLPYMLHAWMFSGVLTELVLDPVVPALSRAKATMTLLFSPAQWTTIWL